MTDRRGEIALKLQIRNRHLDIQTARYYVDAVMDLCCDQPIHHSDDIAVNRFATAMKEKLAEAREKGRGGWQECTPGELSRMLREHIEKGDPRDVANFCAFLWNLKTPIVKIPHKTGKPITNREMEVLQLIAKGGRVKEVAKQLKISDATVKSHVCGLYRKLNAKNRTEAVYLARQLEII